MEGFWLHKWRLIKQKANLKIMLCSHQWGDLLFGHTKTTSTTNKGWSKCRTTTIWVIWVVYKLNNKVNHIMNFGDYFIMQILHFLKI
jgi:VanZ family protein